MNPKIEELLNRYNEDLKKDCEVNPLNLSDVCYNISMLRQKWFDRTNQCKRLIRQNEDELNKKITNGSIKFDLTKGKRVDLSEKAQKNQQNEEPELRELQSTIMGLKTLLEFCDGASIIINSMQWDLRNIIKNNELNQS